MKRFRLLMLITENDSRLTRFRGRRISGIICLNGPAARIGTVGDEVIIIAYAEFDELEAKNYVPQVVLVDDKNRIRKIIKGHLDGPESLKKKENG